MIGRHTPISRRTILRGAGASLALPWLEAMMPVGASAASHAPVRMAVLYMANGVREDMWTPTGTGRDFTLSPTLQPLANLSALISIATAYRWTRWRRKRLGIRRPSRRWN
jgi:hypothetical protein